jgi:ketosteroid isomerase-like protein
MPVLPQTTDPLATALRLQQATNDHDIDALAACFAEDYVNDTPAHPSRSFVGRDQVRQNWTRILAAVPDLTSTMVASAASGDDAWVEWAWEGTRRDGERHHMRGVTVITARAGLVAAARFYMEPVVRDEVGIDEAIRHATGAPVPA